MKRNVKPWPLGNFSQPELSGKVPASVSDQTEGSNA